MLAIALVTTKLSYSKAFKARKEGRKNCKEPEKHLNFL
jgi:hypothetical protein